jgi:hypothetical protein
MGFGDADVYDVITETKEQRKGKHKRAPEEEPQGNKNADVFRRDGERIERFSYGGRKFIPGSEE